MYLDIETLSLELMVSLVSTSSLLNRAVRTFPVTARRARFGSTKDCHASVTAVAAEPDIFLGLAVGVVGTIAKRGEGRSVVGSDVLGDRESEAKSVSIHDNIAGHVRESQAIDHAGVERSGIVARLTFGDS